MRLIILIIGLLLLPIVSSLLIEEGVIISNNAVSYNITSTTGLTLETLVINDDWMIFDNDNISITPNETTIININSWSTNTNSFSTTQTPLNMPFLITRGETLAYVRSGSTDYYEALSLTSIAAFNYAYTGNMSINFFYTNGTSITNKQKNISIISNLSNSPHTTTSTSLEIQQLIPNEYEVRVQAQEMNVAHKFITVNAQSTNTINFYLELNTTSTEEQLFQVVDTSGEGIEGAVIRVQKELSNTTGVFKTVDEAITGSDGKTYVWLEKERDIYYRFGVAFEGEFRTLSPSGATWTSKQSFLSGVEDTIQLIIEETTGGSGSAIEDATAVTTGVSWSEDELTITYYWADAKNSISGATLEVWGRFIQENLTIQRIAIQSSDDFSGSLSYTFTPVNNTYYEIRAYIDYATSTELVWSGSKTFTIDVKVDKNTGLLIAAIILLLIAFLTIKWGSLVSSVLAVGSLSVTKIIGFIDLPTTIITSLIALMIILLLRTKNNA